MNPEEETTWKSPPAGPDRHVVGFDSASEAVDRLAALGYPDGEALIMQLQIEADDS